MKATLLITVVLLTVINAFTQEEKQKADKVEKIIKDSCCCEIESSCIINGKKVRTKDIVVDFRSKEIGLYDYLKRIRKGEYVRVKVMNYNPYLYKVVVNSTDSSVTAPVDMGNVLTKFLDPGNLSTFITGLSDKVGMSTLSGPGITGLHDSIEVAAEDMYEIGACLKKKKIIRSKKEIEVIDTTATVKCLNKFYSRLVYIFTLIDSFSTQLKDQIDTVNFNFLRQFSVRRNLYPDCNHFSKPGIDSFIEHLKSEYARLRTELNTGIVGLNEEQRKYADAIEPFADLITGITSLKDNHKKATKFFEAADSVFSSFKDVLSLKSLDDMMSKLENLAMASSCYISLPIFMSEEIKKINIELRSKADSLGITDYSTTLIIPPFQQRIWGVSGGVYVTSLKNIGYGIQTVLPSGTVTDTTYNLVKDGSGSMQFGISGLAYTGWKLKYNSNNPDYLGVCFGAGISVESKPKPRILLGGSFISGEKNRLVISAGIIAGNVRRLSNAYESLTGLKVLPADFLKDEMKASWFFSINYSFLSK